MPTNLRQSNLIDLPIDELHFDPENPRLPDRLKGAADQQVLEYLLLECGLVELMLSIGEKGYFSGEPLLVVSRTSGGYTVVEGNRRLGALKLLASDGLAPVKPNEVRQARETTRHKPKSVPTLQFNARSDILSYLGYRHITGIKEWGPLAKARYLRQLRDLQGQNDAEAHKALARDIGSKATNVAKLLTGLTLLDRARDLGILNELRRSEDEVDFSLLTTGIGWEAIQKFIGLEGVTDVHALNLKEREFKEFFKWVFDKRERTHSVLGESRNFPALARIVQNARALESLRRGEPLTTADLHTMGPIESLRRFMSEAESSLRSAQESLTHAKGINRADVDQAERLNKSARIFSNALASELQAELDADDAIEA